MCDDVIYAYRFSISRSMRCSCWNVQKNVIVEWSILVIWVAIFVCKGRNNIELGRGKVFGTDERVNKTWSTLWLCMGHSVLPQTCGHRVSRIMPSKLWGDLLVPIISVMYCERDWFSFGGHLVRRREFDSLLGIGLRELLVVFLLLFESFWVLACMWLNGRCRCRMYDVGGNRAFIRLWGEKEFRVSVCSSGWVLLLIVWMEIGKADVLPVTRIEVGDENGGRCN